MSKALTKGLKKSFFRKFMPMVLHTTKDHLMEYYVQ